MNDNNLPKMIIEVPDNISGEQIQQFKHLLDEKRSIIVGFPIKIHYLGESHHTDIIRKGERINWRQIIENGH